MKPSGVVAAGNVNTAEAGAAIISAGGNAFDAAVAAVCAACHAEPVLASFGGGGFFLAHPAESPDRVYDFFVQTPRRARPPAETGFYPITCDFGATTQEFHIGCGAIATPGLPRGLWRVHRDLGRLPLGEIVAPAIDFTRNGIPLDPMQQAILCALREIYTAKAPARSIFGDPETPGAILRAGATFRNPDFASVLAVFARDGAAPFYTGDYGRQLAHDCAEIGGHLTLEDLHAYEVAVREPLRTQLEHVAVLTNPPPAAGGLLIAFAVRLLQMAQLGRAPFGSFEHLALLARAMQHADAVRTEMLLGKSITPQHGEQLLQGGIFAKHSAALQRWALSQGNTTHVSVADAAGNLASVTVTNGEGCGYVLPGTGIVLNNMLGEQDLQPGGFHRWPPNQRLASMMAPTILLGKSHSVALGSGGSNRLRSAILQVLVNLIEYDLPIAQAVNHGRVHFEDGLLHLETDFSAAVIERLRREFGPVKLWQGTNFFFGGVHAAMSRGDAPRFDGAGDHRRGGVCLIVE